MTRRGRVAQAVGSVRQLSGNHDVRRLGIAQAGVEAAAWAYGIAFSIYAYGEGGAALVGVAAFSRLAGAAVAAPFTRSLVDRFESRAVLAAADAVAAALLAVTAAAAALGLPVAFALVLCAAIGLCQSARRPARSALLRDLTRSADELSAANVVSGSIQRLALFIGPAVGGLLAAATGPWVVFVLAAAVFAASALLALRLPREPARARGRREPPWVVLQSLRTGLAAFVSERRLRILAAIFIAQTLVLGALNVLLVIAALELLDMGDAGVGLLVSAIGAGALAGSLFAVDLVGRRLAPALRAGVFAWGLPLILIGMYPNAALAVPLLVLAGAATVLVDVTVYTLLQRAAADGSRARVMGTFETLVMASLALGGAVAPVLIAAAGEQGALIAAGALMPLLVVLLWQPLREIDAATVWPAHETRLVASIEIFSALPRATIEGLATGLVRVSVPAGREIVTQGSPGQRFYIVDDGDVEVFVDGRLVRTQGPGSYFGEISLLRDQPRTATVRALEDVELLSLEPAEFVAAVTGHAVTAEAVEAVIGERLAHARPQLASL